MIDHFDMLKFGIDREETPVGIESPLIFHVLTGLPMGRSGGEAMFKWIREGAILVPAVDREGGKYNKIMARDKAAGDNRFLFFSPGMPLSTTFTHGQPALAWTVDEVMTMGDVGFRLFDLESQYALCEQVVHDDQLDPADWEDEFDNGGEVEDPEVDEARLNEARAAQVAESLEIIADAGTAWGDDAQTILQLFNESLRTGGNIRDHAQAGGIDLGKLIPHELRSYPREQEFDDFAECAYELPRVMDNLYKGWEWLFKDNNLSDLSMRPRDHSEILVEAQIPLCTAKFYRDWKDEWHPLPQEVCDEGMKAVRGFGGFVV